MQYNWHNKSVLVAEDDPIIFKYLKLLLEKRTGVNVVWAKDGQEAFEKIINHFGIDLVLLDLQLPELNGIDVLKQAKAIIPDLPIIMQTANSWNNEEENCLDAGADGFFPKPFKIDDLFEKMDMCMKEFSRLKKNRVQSLDSE
jgi:CheY-like chemotaxis protein